MLQRAMHHLVTWQYSHGGGGTATGPTLPTRSSPEGEEGKQAGKGWNQGVPGVATTGPGQPGGVAV